MAEFHHQYFARDEKYAFEVAMLSAFESTQDLEVAAIKHLYKCFEKGYSSMPFYFPGSPFYQSMKARRSLNENIRKMTQGKKDRGKSTSGSGGLLEALIDDDTSRDNGESNRLSDSQIADGIIGVIFAAHDTSASALTWVLKFLHDNEESLESVKKEQNEVRSKLIEANRDLTWSDTRCMPTTSRVIQETLRRASILSFTFREAVEDIEFDGCLIPKGWSVLPLFRSIHHSADFFQSPEEFNPSSFEVPPKANTYMPFGNGAHSCPGSELARLEMLVLHHLTNTFFFFTLFLILLLQMQQLC